MELYIQESFKRYK